MVGALIDSARFVATLNEVQKRKLPAATLRALNQSAFEVRDAWKAEVSKVFDRPTRLTLNAPLYRKATPDKLVAEVYIRDDATKGTPPSEYLKPQAFGGSRQQRRAEAHLARNLGFPRYFVPGRAAPLDRYGNLKAGVIGRILAQLHANFDPAQNETTKSKARRVKRQRKRGGGGSYFVLPVNRGKLKRGIVYERSVTRFGGSSVARPILIGTDTPPSYRVRFDARAVARRIFAERYRANFRKQVARIRSASAAPSQGGA